MKTLENAGDIFRPMPVNAGVLGIIEIGDPILRKNSKEISPITFDEMQGFDSLVNNMIATSYHNDGAGLAAPQIGRSLRAFVVTIHPTRRYPQAPRIQPFVVVNPEITMYRGKKEKVLEGCLSIPGLFGLVPRWPIIDVSFQTVPGGKSIELRLNGFVARVFQHELDHLDGKLFIDHADPLELCTERHRDRLLWEHKRRHTALNRVRKKASSCLDPDDLAAISK